jgi:hypothetical protein
MGKKNNKGRQSDGFGYKSLRAVHQHEINDAVNDAVRWTRRETSSSWTQERHRQQNKERPRFSLDATNSLRHILRERRSEDSYFLRERRRRNGFLPTIATTTAKKEEDIYSTEGGLVHPPGWILRYNNYNNNEELSSSSSPSSSLSDNDNNSSNNNNNVNKLQNLSLIVFSKYIHEYQNVMGHDTLHTILSLLSSNCLMELSILLCSSSSSSSTNNNNNNNNNRIPVERKKKNNNNNNPRKQQEQEQEQEQDEHICYTTNDDLAVLIGQHPHVERLCLRGNGGGGGGGGATTTTTTHTNNKNKNKSTLLLTDAGLLKLIPKTTILRQRQRQQPQLISTKNIGNNINYLNNDQDKNEDDSDDNEKDNDDDNESVLECWEEVEDDDDDHDDHDDSVEHDYHDDHLDHLDHLDHTEYHDDYAYEEEENNNNGSVIIDGIVGSLKLRRLELLDLCGGKDGIISSDVILRWFDKCSGITHLSLAGSFFNNSWSIGRTILLELHKVLSYLEVLDITRCPWVTDSLIIRFMEGYYNNNNNNNSNSNSATNKHSTSYSDNISRVVASKTSSSMSLPIVYYYRGRFTLNEKQKEHLLNSQQHQDDHWW